MHKEYKRISEHADKAILFIHGIVGTPNHFGEFVKLVPDDLSVYNILLDGHGKGVADFSKTSMEKWKRQVADAVEELAKDHNEIYVVGHSLGCLLAIEQSVVHANITKMFLLAVPLRLFLKPKMFLNSLKVFFGKIDPKNDELMSAKACYGIGEDKNPFRYLGWVPRFLELFCQIRNTRKIINRINIPCVAFQSAKDEMVSNKSQKILAENPGIVTVELRNSGHYYYDQRDASLLKNAFAEFIS